MSNLSANEIEKIATSLASEFIRGAGELDTLLEKAARLHGWNSEQIHRVGRKANVKVFEQKFASMASQQDRVVSFNIADSQAVIEKIHSGASQKVASDASYPALPNELENLREAARPKLARKEFQLKTAMENLVDEKPLEERQSHMRNAVIELKSRTGQTAERLAAARTKFATEHNTIYWDHAEFEKQAVCCLGSRALVELNALREELNIQAAVPFTKEAADFEYENFLAPETESIVQFEKLCELRESFNQHLRALNAATQRLHELGGKV